MILASLHVCIPLGTSMEDWELAESELQHCFSAYGIKHVTMSPELERVVAVDTLRRSESTDDLGKCGKDGPGCIAVAGKSQIRKRRDDEETV